MIFVAITGGRSIFGVGRMVSLGVNADYGDLRKMSRIINILFRYMSRTSIEYLTLQKVDC